jgi:hypothetical protein
LGESDYGFVGVILRYFPVETEENIKTALLSKEHVFQNILWRRVPAIIVGWFAASTWKNNSQWYT